MLYVCAGVYVHTSCVDRNLQESEVSAPQELELKKMEILQWVLWSELGSSARAASVQLHVLLFVWTYIPSSLSLVVLCILSTVTMSRWRDVLFLELESYECSLQTRNISISSEVIVNRISGLISTHWTSVLTFYQDSYMECSLVMFEGQCLEKVLIWRFHWSV